VEKLKIEVFTFFVELSGYDPEMAECKSAVIANFTIAPLKSFTVYLST
jgi:hypothetical protein